MLNVHILVKISNRSTTLNGTIWKRQSSTAGNKSSVQLNRLFLFYVNTIPSSAYVQTNKHNTTRWSAYKLWCTHIVEAKVAGEQWTDEFGCRKRPNKRAKWRGSHTRRDKYTSRFPDRERVLSAEARCGVLILQQIFCARVQIMERGISAEVWMPPLSACQLIICRECF